MGQGHIFMTHLILDLILKHRVYNSGNLFTEISFPPCWKNGSVSFQRMTPKLYRFEGWVKVQDESTCDIRLSHALNIEGQT